MYKEKKIFTLENIKLVSMGPDTIVYIPRALIKHKILDPKKRYNVHFEEIIEKNMKREINLLLDRNIYYKYLILFYYSLEG